MDDLWDEETASARVGVSAKTLARWRKAGTGPPYVAVGRKVRYWPEDGTHGSALGGVCAGWGRRRSVGMHSRFGTTSRCG